MSFIGFATINPVAAMSVLDSNKWRTVVYADTPRTKARYQNFLSGEKESKRKPILFLFGATSLYKVSKDIEQFHSVLVFDELQNLHYLSKAIDTFKIVDIEEDETGNYPKQLSPVELQEAVAEEGLLPKKIPLLNKITSSLGVRKPSVLESTSRMPTPEAVPESGAQKLLSEIKAVLEATNSELPFQVVLDTYVKFLFRIVKRATVTSLVTKKLPKEAKELWQIALNLANSDVGLNMAKAFRSLCVANDPDYRVSHAVNKYGLKAYSGDFLYFNAVLPPNGMFSFTNELNDLDDESVLQSESFKPPVTKKTTKKKSRKKA